jgi:hypothetical protein
LETPLNGRTIEERRRFSASWQAETPLVSDVSEIARWDFDSLLEQRLSGYGCRFYIIGILAALRSVQHSLYAHDRNLSSTHKKIIETWWKKTSNRELYPDLGFIKNARDLILKAGSFDSYASYSESATGEGNNLQITGTDYDLAYYDESGERHDLKEAIEFALNWCDRELTQIESQIE